MEMPEENPLIGEDDVRQIASEQSFERGVVYYQGGALHDRLRQGNELQAYCEGSSYAPYRVSAVLGAEGIISTYCTCPFDWGGACKHSVALLLAWVDEPGSFHDVATLDAGLEGRSKEQLIALIKEMLKRQPDLERLLDVPVLADIKTPVDLDAFRRLLNSNLDQEYLDTEVMANDLATIVETGDRYAAGGDLVTAGTLYHLVLSEIVPHYENLYDEHGFISSELKRCAKGLERCLKEGSFDAEIRRLWLEALLEAEIKDVKMGGVDLAYPANEVLVYHATQAEWTWIEARLRQVIDSLDNRHSNWGRETLVNFLVQRLSERKQEGEIADLIFELGSPEQQAFLLLRQGRFEAAVKIARDHFEDLPGLVIQFADALVEAGANEAAVAFVSDQLGGRYEYSYLPWLAQQAEAQGDFSTATRWWQEEFRQRPNLGTYQRLRDSSQRLGAWKSRRQELIAELEEGDRTDIMIEIALAEGEVERAIELLPRHRGWSSYDLLVAQTAEADYPETAIGIYQDQVEKLIRLRGRGNYRGAAEILQRIRDLYKRESAQFEWEVYLADLRERHRRLKALKDELNRAGLG